MDLRFPQSEHDIPMLSLERQPIALDLPMMVWGAVKRGRPMRGTYHFFTNDFEFTRVWDSPDIVVQSECVAVVEPNFSVFTDTPLPVALWAIYRKRWLARYWQERGINVWVDLRVAPSWRDVNLLGVPRGWRAFATRGYADDLSLLEHDYATARQRCEAEPTLLVYGGGQTVAEYCSHRGWIHQHSEEIRRRVREVKNAKRMMARALELPGSRAWYDPVTELKSRKDEPE